MATQTIAKTGEVIQKEETTSEFSARLKKEREARRKQEIETQEKRELEKIISTAEKKGVITTEEASAFIGAKPEFQDGELTNILLKQTATFKGGVGSSIIEERKIGDVIISSRVVKKGVSRPMIEKAIEVPETRIEKISTIESIKPSIDVGTDLRPSRVTELKEEFLAGFSFRPSPSQDFTPEQKLEVALTGRNPITGEKETTFEASSKSLVNLLGFGSNLLASGAGRVIGKTVQFIPGGTSLLKGAKSFFGNPLVLGTLTVLAGKEVVKAGEEEGSTGVVRSSLTIARDVALIGGAFGTVDAKPLGFPIKSEKFIISTGEGDVTIRSIGLDIGTRGTPLISKTPEGIKFGIPTIKEPIPIESLSKPIPQTRTAQAGKVLKEVIKLTPEEKLRIESAVEVSRAFGKEAGLKPKDILLNVKGLKNPEVSSKVIEEFTRKEEGVIFGSAITQRLPEFFQNEFIGDVDIFIKEQSVSEISPKLEKLTVKLRSVGEDVIFDPESNSIKFVEGGKVLEVKSGIDQTELQLEDEPPDQFLGFDVSDTTGIKFGETKGITAGQQLLRKGSASLIISPPSKAEFPSFEAGGVIGKITPENIRGTKDIAGFIQTGRGLEALGLESKSPFARARARRGGKAIEAFEETFTPEQRVDIAGKIKGTIIGDKIRIPIDDVISPKVEVTGGFGSQRLSSTPSDIPVSEFSFREISSGIKPSEMVSPIIESPSIISEASLISPDSPPTSIISPSDLVSSIISPKPPSPSPSPSPSLISPPSPPSPSPSPPSPPPSLISPPSPPSPSPSPPSPPPSLISPPSPPPSSPPSLISPPSPPPPSPRLKSGKDFLEGLFRVEVGRRERKTFFEDKGLTLTEAFEKGFKGVESTPAATFKVFKGEEEVTLREEEIQSMFSGRIRKGKTGGFVEKRKFRISSLGELKGITQKGIEATRGKKNRFF